VLVITLKRKEPWQQAFQYVGLELALFYLHPWLLSFWMLMDGKEQIWYGSHLSSGKFLW